MSDTDRIIQLVSQQPGLRAKQIAKLFGIQKKDVSLALHGILRSKVVQDESYGWWIKDPSSKAPPQDTVRETKTASLRQEEQIMPDQAVIAKIPAPGPSTLRRTDQVLLDMIQTARNSLIIVTFVAYKIPRIVSAIAEAAKRGVSITLILESPEENEGKVTFGALKAMGNEVAARSEVYVWPNDQRKADKDGHYGSLHAKCAIADENVLFLSSTNLTEYALDLNIEMGLLIRGGKLPKQADDHFRNLMSHSVLRKV